MDERWSLVSVEEEDAIEAAPEGKPVVASVSVLTRNGREPVAFMLLLAWCALAAHFVGGSLHPAQAVRVRGHHLQVVDDAGTVEFSAGVIETILPWSSRVYVLLAHPIEGRRAISFYPAHHHAIDDLKDAMEEAHRLDPSDRFYG